LSGVLEHAGPYTVFAPSDEAFAKLPVGAVESLLAAPDTLADVVGYHLVAGRMTATDIAGRISAETLQGEETWPSPTTAPSGSTAPASSPATSKPRTGSSMSSIACCYRHASERSTKR